MISVDWFYERMKFVKEVAKKVEVENVAICIPLEPKTACMIYELSKYTEVLPAALDKYSTKKEAVDWLEEKGIKILRKRDAAKADFFIDCAAVLSRAALRLGKDLVRVVELTKTGEEILNQFGVKVKAISVDSSNIKIFESSYGTAFGLLEALLKLNIFLPGKRVTVFGFGKVGKGVAKLLRAIGCIVSVWDASLEKRLETSHEGFEVLKKLEDADIIITCTGRKCIGKEEISLLKDGCILVNLGAEFEIQAFGDLAADYGSIKKFSFENKHYYLVADGYAANLAMAYGTPIEIMDRTFAASILALNWLKKDFSGVIPLPKEIEQEVLSL